MHVLQVLCKHAVCQHDSWSCSRTLGVVAEESESRYGWNHFLGRPCFKQNFARTSASERQEKYCAALSQIACCAKFTLCWGWVQASVFRRYDGIRSRSSKLEISLVRLRRRVRRRAIVNLLCPPECFALSFIYETVPNVFQELANRIELPRLHIWSLCDFRELEHVRVWAYLENRLLRSSFPYMCFWETWQVSWNLNSSWYESREMREIRKPYALFILI